VTDSDGTPERTFCSTTATSPERGSSSARSA
jgi:hypothetical protein